MSWRVWLPGLLAFAVVMLVVLPARWIAGALPADVRCAEWRGTVWQGRCQQLTLSAPGEPSVTIESAGWTLHPLPLLRARVAAEVALTDARGDATGHVEFARGGLLVLREVSARALLDSHLPSALPAGWRGRVEVQQLDLDWQMNQLRHLQGDLHLLDLRDEQGHEIGNYHLNFPAATAPPFKGQLSDEGGPLQLHGTLELTMDRHWTLTGTAAQRAGSDAALGQYLEALGAPDSAGRYPLSVTGSFR